MSNITKRDLVIDLSNKSGLTQSQVVELVESFIGLASQRLSEGNNITLRGFGTFEVRVAKSKIGRNPHKPGSEVRIPDRCVIRFKPGRELKDAVARVPVEKVRGQPPPAEA
jgi:nucleoid DNA-binding protein